jgi:hypothetical protein
LLHCSLRKVSVFGKILTLIGSLSVG